MANAAVEASEYLRKAKDCLDRMETLTLDDSEATQLATQAIAYSSYAAALLAFG